MKHPLLLAFILPAIAGVARPDVLPAAVFCDHAVLQQGKPIPIWGTASPGERVGVTYADASVHTTADASGRWRVDLPARKADPASRELVIKGRNTVSLQDVVVGEVWLASGQSNMEFIVKNAYDAALDVPVPLPLVRQFKVNRQVADEPAAGAQGRWLPAGPDTTGYFSAVAFYFARDLQARLGVPVGVINSSWGGTRIESWMPPETLKSDPTFAAVTERWRLTLDHYPSAKTKYDQDLAAWKKRKDEAATAGKTFGERAPDQPVGPGHQNTPAGLYNGMIQPLAPYAMRGVIWYQGESNRMSASEYHPLFAAMIAGWRARFAQGDLPFFWVQLPNFRGNGVDQTEYADLRGAQAETLSAPATGQAVAIDIGDANNIHPKNKLDVGRRLARLALHRAYGFNLVDSGPTVASVVREGPGYRVTFNDTAGGLICPLNTLSGFAVAGADKVFHPAEATLAGNAVIVACPAGVSDPAALRYAWTNAPVAGLFNDEGLPAAPFRTDSW